MHVFILIGTVEFELSEVLGVFETFDSAKEFLIDNESELDYDHYYVEEHIVGGERINSVDILSKK